MSDRKKCIFWGILFIISLMLGISGIILISIRIDNIEKATCVINKCEVLSEECERAGIKYECYGAKTNYTFEYKKHEYYLSRYEVRYTVFKIANETCDRMMGKEEQCYFFTDNIEDSISFENDAYIIGVLGYLSSLFMFIMSIGALIMTIHYHNNSINNHELLLDNNIIQYHNNSINGRELMLDNNNY